MHLLGLVFGILTAAKIGAGGIIPRSVGEYVGISCTGNPHGNVGFCLDRAKPETISSCTSSNGFEVQPDGLGSCNVTFPNLPPFPPFLCKAKPSHVFQGGSCCVPSNDAEVATCAAVGFCIDPNNSAQMSVCNQVFYGTVRDTGVCVEGVKATF
jgi:hypothetical protein